MSPSNSKTKTDLGTFYNLISHSTKPWLINLQWYNIENADQLNKETERFEGVPFEIECESSAAPDGGEWSEAWRRRRVENWLTAEVERRPDDTRVGGEGHVGGVSNWKCPQAL